MKQLMLPAMPPSPPPETLELDNQFTPRSVFFPLNLEFQFTLDPCATSESAKCKKFFRKRQNGLARSWRGERVFLNPPYSNVGEWLDKVKREIRDGGCRLVVALLPSWTDRKWWQSFIEPIRDRPGGCEVRFIPGRITFGCPGNPEGQGRDTASFPSCVVIWRAVAPAKYKPQQERKKMAPTKRAKRASAKSKKPLNPYGVRTGDLWKPNDPRGSGEPFMIYGLELKGGFARVGDPAFKGKIDGRKIRLDSFRGGTRGYTRLEPAHAATEGKHPGGEASPSALQQQAAPDIHTAVTANGHGTVEPTPETKRTDVAIIDWKQEQDGRFLAFMDALPGVQAYGGTREEAVEAASKLARDVITERKEHGEAVPEMVEKWLDASIRADSRTEGQAQSA